MGVKTPVLLFKNGIMTARCRAVTLAYLPNKKILFLIVFILLIFAGWFYFSDYKNKQMQYIAEKEKSPLAVALDTTSQLDADSDSDGLKDWEELLWKTDPNKIDTDGDGTNDNEEITLNRNPLKAGPDDKISDKEDLVAQEKAVSDSKQNTLTASYARKFLTEYLLLKQQKGDLTEEDKQQLVDSVISGIKPLEVEDKYKLSDLKISDDNSKEAIEKYAGEMKKIFINKEYFFLNNQAVFEVLLKKLKNKDSDYSPEVSVLGSSANFYDWFVKKMTEINTIPSVFEKEHVELINGLNGTAIAIRNMAKATDDPIKAMMGSALYDKQIEIIYKATRGIQSVFNKYEIIVFK